MAELLDEASELASAGVKELIVIAQDITRYGTDFNGEHQLPALLRELCKLDFHWIRLHYLYPDEITEELIDTIAEEKKIVSYLDIPIQHCNDGILKAMNRRDTKESLRKVFHELRERVPGLVLRTSIIAGLPGDTVAGFEHSLRQAIALDPENITVHTLTLKRASRIVIEDQKENDYADVAAMLEKCHLLAEAGYRPYYLYRQKNTLQNLENVGWCKPGHEGYYNIYIMEEVQTILSAGAGGSTKLVADGGKRMQRIFNFKYPTEYIQRFAEVLERKKGVAEFYDHNLGTETTG